MTRNTILALIVSLLLAGCATQKVTPNEGTGPYPSNHRQVITDFIKARLKDPYSVKDLQISEPIPCEHWVGLINGGKMRGYCVVASFNAKNSFGAYVGVQQYDFIIRNNQVAWTTFD